MEKKSRVPVSVRLKQIMAERHLKQADILRMVAPFCEIYGEKIGSNALSEWVNGKYEPNLRKLTILGMALNVSEAWLMGFEDVPRERDTAINETSARNQTLTEADLRLIRAYRANRAAQIYVNRILGLPDPEGGDK